MKSLKLIKHLCYDQHRDVITSATCLAVDSDTGHVYFTTREYLVCLDPSLNLITSLTSLQDYIHNENDYVVAIQHLADEMALCLAISSGDVLLYSTGGESLECVGSVESGIKSMSWSPDQELVVLVTGEEKLNIMTREFDTLVDCDLNPDDFGEAKFVNVGWGKKETQFHGSEGKQAAKQKPVEEAKAADTDDGKTRVSWRGDGQYFATSCLSRLKGCRIIRTWTREGTLHSTSELVPGLEHSLDWKPSGSLIASTQQLPNKHIVRFFERNGLIHGEFCIEKEARVREVKWNVDSTVLCLWLEEGEESVLQLWTVNNYHWYHKQTVKPGQKLAGFMWDLEHVCRLHTWTGDGRYHIYEWAWSTYVSHCDVSAVAVVDGRDLLITPFRRAVVPPPMAGYTLRMPSHAQLVSFSPSSNRIAVLTLNNVVIIHDVIDKCDGSVVTSEKTYQLEERVKLYHTTQSSLSHMTLLNDDTVLFIAHTTEPQFTIFVQKIVANSGVLSTTAKLSHQGSILAVDATDSKLAIQSESGEIWDYDWQQNIYKPWLDGNNKKLVFPQPCTRMKICTFDNETVVIGLTDRYRFYINDLEVASNCTSFCVHNNFVLLTTHAHTIRCIPRLTKVKDLVKLADDKAHPFDECVRRVERGSQIVTSLLSGTSVVLQMPRGNLETIHPRALVLGSVRDSLDKTQYLQAFTLMKKHRINMNLIYDHNPKKFLSETEVFVNQIGKAENLNIFLTELCESDVTVTMYDAAYKDRKSGKNGVNKVDTICDKIRQTLSEVDEAKFFLSILTCFVKKTEPDLANALFKIRELKELKISISLDQAMKYLLYLVDVNQLFDIALGTYDFDLVLMVAERSQKDPKEYLPLLNQLRNMEENYRKFTIDKMLRRHSSALQNIVKCGEEKFEECLKLVVDCGLYTKALTLYTKNSEQYRKIAKAQGHFLEEKKYYEESGLAYWKGQDWENAMSVFTKSLSWQECLTVAENAKLDPQQKSELAKDLSEKLKSAGKFHESAQVSETYLNDYEEAIVTLIEGELWSNALNLIYRYNREDFMETNLKPKVKESLEHHEEQLPELRRQFEAYYDRLCDVRNEKERRHLELLADPTYNDGDADLYSDISSASGDSVTSKRTQSSFFSTTSRTNRAKRKAERKKFSLKPGSPNEDLALVDALMKLIVRLEQTKTEIGPLLKILVLFDFTTEATRLQDFLVEFLDLVKKRIPEIWLEDDMTSEVTSQVGGDSAAQARWAVAQQRREALKAELNKEPTLRTPPIIKASQEWKLRTLKSD